MATTGWDLDGTDLRRIGYNIRTADGWDAFPASRAAALEHPFRHGEELSDRVFYKARDVSLAIMVLPTAPDGSVTLSGLEHVRANLDALMGLFHGRTGLRTLTQTLPDGSTQRQAKVRVVDSFVVNGLGGNDAARLFVARLRMPYPFWSELPAKNVNGTGSLVLANGGNAPIQNAVITFSTAGRLTHDATGDYLEVDSVAGGSVVVDLGAWTVTQAGSPADARLSYNRGWLMEFDPGNNGLTATATVSIDYYDSYF